MSGPLWAQVLVSVIVLGPLFVIFGALVSLATGGVVGCSQYLLGRMGAVKLASGVSLRQA